MRSGSGPSRRGRARRPGVKGGFALLAAIGALAAGVAVEATSASATTTTTPLATDTFTGAATVSSNWTYSDASSGDVCLTAGTDTSQTPIPGCDGGSPAGSAVDTSGDGVLQLTKNTGDQNGAVFNTLSLPTTEGLDIKFNAYQWGGSGADGIAFSLAATNPSAPSAPSSPGGFGSALGYATGGNGTDQNGLTDGYLGFGLDAWGNFSNGYQPASSGAGAGGSDCSYSSSDIGTSSSPGGRPDITVRGPGNGTSGYCIVPSSNGGLDGYATTSSTTQTELTKGSLDVPTVGAASDVSGNRPTAVPVEIAINPGAATTTSDGLAVPANSWAMSVVTYKNGTQTMSGPLPSLTGNTYGIPSSWYSSSGLPYQLTFGWTSSTGGDDDYHAINNLDATTLNGATPIYDIGVTDSSNGYFVTGQSGTVTVAPTLSSTGGDENDPATVTTTLPAGLGAQTGSFAANGWACTGTADASGNVTETCTQSPPAGGWTAGSALPTISIPVTPTASGNDTVNATVSSNDASPASATDAIAVDTPAVTITKSASATSYSAAGTKITYTYTVANTGTDNGADTLTGITVSDAMSGMSTPTCAATTLAPGDSTTCTATYTTTQADLDNDTTLTNTGTVNADGPNGSTVSATSNTVTIPAQLNPGLLIIKSANPSTYSAAGTTVTYSYRVSNVGNVTMGDIGVTDSMSGVSTPTCAATTLAPGETTTCTATYTTTQAELDKGTTLTNTATASGTDPDDASITASGTSNQVNVSAVQNPGLSITKSASASSYSAAETTITYTYQVQNTGNVTLGGISVADTMQGQGLTTPVCQSTTLAPGASTTCTATYTTTQNDIDNNTALTNTATASGTDPSDSSVTATSGKSNQVTVTPNQAPGLSITKTAGTTSVSAVGNTVTYTFDVQNTGNVTMSDVGVTDTQSVQGESLASGPTCETVVTGSGSCTTAGGGSVVSSMAPGDEATFTATYAVTQTDLDNGYVKDTATASGTPPATATDPTPSPVTSPGSTLSVSANQNTGLAIVKSASVSSYSAAGTQITYTYKVTNTGNVTMSHIAVTDPMKGLSAVSCPSATLAPGASEICTATYTTSQQDVDAGSLSNTGTVSATPPATVSEPSPSQVTESSTLTIPANQTPAVTIVKSASVGSYSTAGTTITYSYKVTNTGNVTMSHIAVTDPMKGLSAVSCPSATLAPGASETCTATYTTTAADVTAKSVKNTGTVSATPPATASDPNPKPTTAQSSLTIPLAQITVTKTPSVTTVSHARQKVTYRYKVTNTGAVTVNGVTVTDPMKGLSGIKCPTKALAPGQSETCTATYTVPKSALHRKALPSTTGTATGRLADGTKVSATSKAGVTVKVAQERALGLKKTASRSRVSPGQNVTYTLTLTNPNARAVTGAKVCDSLPSGEVYVSSSRKAHLTGGRYCWTFKRIAAHAKLTIKITVNVTRTKAGKITNHATAAGSGVPASKAQATITDSGMTIGSCVAQAHIKGASSKLRPHC